MDSEHRKQWVKLIIFALPVSVLLAIVPNYHAVVLSVLFVGCLGTDYRTFLKIYVAVVGIVVLSAMILSIAFDIRVMDFKGRRHIRLEESISFRQFNEKGKLLLQLPVNLGGRSTEIIVEPKEGVSLALHSIGYEVLR